MNVYCKEHVLLFFFCQQITNVLGRYQRIWGLICSPEVGRKCFLSCICWPCFLKWLWWKTWSRADVKHLVSDQGLPSTTCWVKLARKWNICLRKNVEFLEFLSHRNKSKTSSYRESKWTERGSAWSTAMPSFEAIPVRYGKPGLNLQHVLG